MTAAQRQSSIQNIPLRQKLRIAVIGTTIITALLVVVAYIFYEWQAQNKQLQDDLEVRARIIGANSTAALSFNDAVSAREIVDALAAAPDVISACTYRLAENGSEQLFASFVRNDTEGRCPPTVPQGESLENGNARTVVAGISLDGEQLGSVSITADLSQLWARVAALARASLIISVFVVALAIAFSRIVERAIAQPVMELHGVVEEVSESQNYNLRATPAGSDEIGALITGFNSMLEQIDRRDRDLITAQNDLQDQIEKRDQTNQELQSTLRKLQDTQDQLVQSEKMASLGGLVAGVAHEINTPIGVAFTAASTLQARSNELRQAYESDSLGRRMLNTYVEQSNEIADMISKNLTRAAELIQSFKQVAVDQTSSERRHFELREYIDETLTSLKPKIKNLPYQITVECSSEIKMNSYPGAISQILTNLILNSVKHAFEGRDAGNIRIVAVQHDDMITMEYSDDGIGMSTEHKAKIFDPFFTTKRGQGGSGLGMHIVYNLVTTTLGGKIQIMPSDSGMHFQISFPEIAPA